MRVGPSVWGLRRLQDKGVSKLMPYINNKEQTQVLSTASNNNSTNNIPICICVFLTCNKTTVWLVWQPNKIIRMQQRKWSDMGSNGGYLTKHFNLIR